MHDIHVYIIRTHEITYFTHIWNEPMKPINLWCGSNSLLWCEPVRKKHPLTSMQKIA
jgi:hypothetical protein